MKHVHFIGIEGIGLSGAAKILLASNVEVSGSDLRPGNLSRELHKQGSTIYWGHCDKHITEDIDMVVVSNAIKDNNPEIQEAQKKNIPVVRYPELLGVLMAQKPTGVAVAGTHGKTTTSGLISYILHYAYKHPSFVIGGYVNQLNGNAARGTGEYFITEACEYQRSFLYLAPKIAVITGIEKDHLDYYYNINDICNAYIQFVQNIAKDGLLIIEQKAYAKIKDHIKCEVQTYSGHQKSDWMGKIHSTTTEDTKFILSVGNSVHSFSTKLGGIHNVENCIASIAVAKKIGLSYKVIEKAVAAYRGVKRRFEVLQEDPFVIIDDYAHHPTEIVYAIDTAKEKYQNVKIWCIFQPHQANRTYHLLKNFASSFYNADKIIICDIFYARDNQQDRSRVHAKNLTKELCDNGKEAHYISRFDSIKKFLQLHVQKNEVVLCLGAGSINSLAHSLIQESFA